ncbi:hypothetical protein [Heyndrickxia coagulans]|uniref:hypothetical protein n=1 Tax=Heyndrickxia coagulans TaxID=1398 RepID=UPI0022361C1B|nr:hypothetical protein [Heyndrickxia coagulans]UZH06505.1 hypothetical protein ONG97_00790 [Heyndrickxia coagulans]
MDLLTAAFAVIGFLCIIAFFVFFSFGFSKKGVVVLAGTAFLLALFGILAGNVVPLWESCLIVFLLVLCVAYLFEKKLAFLFAGKDNDADEFPVWDEQEELAVMRENRPAALDWPAANDAVLPAEKSAPAPEMEEILPGKNGPGPETEGALPEEKDEPEWEELEDAAGNETGTALPENEQAAERSGEEEIAFLENRLEMLEETNEEHAVDQLPEMYGVEEWVAEAESPDTNPLDAAAAKEADGQDSEAGAGTGPGTPSGSEDVQYVEQEEIPLLSFEKKTEAPAELSGTDMPAMDELEEIDVIPLHETGNAGQPEKLPSDEEIETVGGAKGEDTVEPEEIDVMPDKETGQAAKPEKLYSEAGQGRKLQDENGAGTGETVAANEAEPAGNPAVEEAPETLASVPNVTTPIQKQLLGVLVEQLNLYRLTQPADAYEQLVKAHLHPQLAPEDYFTFASLLIDHYIAEQQFGKLRSLLRGLAETYAEYPVIREEIDFLRTKYGL